MEIKIHSDDVSIEYLEALKLVLDVRKNKRKVYQDKFMGDDLLFLKYQLENKVKRLTAQMKNGELKELKENTETAVDSCVDIINYAAFIICKIKAGHKK